VGTDLPGGVKAGYGMLPLHFEAVQDPAEPRVKFFSRGSGFTLYLAAAEAVLSLARGEQGAVLRMRLVGANPDPQVRGLDELPGKANYFVGEPSRWRADVPLFRKILYEQVYPGIDLVYYGNQRQLEYDFIVHPGADPERIDILFEGSREIRVSETGDLVVRVTEEDEVGFHRPIIYQERGGKRTPVNGSYRISDRGRAGFAVAAYDREIPLVIDPILNYSTYLGGAGATIEQAFSIAVDSAGCAYVTGNTSSSTFPTTSGAYQTSFKAGTYDAFVTKLNAAGTGLIYSTYVGGGDYEYAQGIAVDSAGSAYLAGFTESTNFPTTSGVYQTARKGYIDAFVTKLNAAGTALVYST
jgi:hypothetical protein